jgi:hypothetical protein
MVLFAAPSATEEVEKAFGVATGLGSRAIERPYVASIPLGQHLTRREGTLLVNRVFTTTVEKRKALMHFFEQQRSSSQNIT